MLNEILGESLKETLTEAIKGVGAAAFAAILAALTTILVQQGVNAAHNWLKNKYNIDIDKSVLEEALRAAKRN